ncbi:hypothetical protein HK097_001455 [Rhizophlyctis rosea]|uniref:Peptidase S26 domain-containing protein n=1 Tax=Rhizophlyctis rosea TaxID=64517 RepID=A0AAD5S6P8_9FUNG|nr:hypothetical protein HK097_001455 [Rhizophlyctis rosea]
MLPTFNMWGDIVLMETISWRWRRKIDLGDVVVAISPADPSKTVLKRVLGLPGDTIIQDPTKPQPERQYITVPPGHVWLQGDNFTNSTDSRQYGPVSMGLIRGKAFCKVWPRVQWIRNGFDTQGTEVKDGDVALGVESQVPG